MERIFTKNVGRYKQGDMRDYPISVWKQMEASERKKLDSFTKPYEQAAKDNVMDRSGIQEPVRMRRAG